MPSRVARHGKRTGKRGPVLLSVLFVVAALILYGSYWLNAAGPVGSAGFGSGVVASNAAAAGVDSTIVGTPSRPSDPVRDSRGCPAAAHTPGGSDGMGACWPGAHNTGYPHGLEGDGRRPVTLTDYAGPCTITGSLTIDGKIIACDISIEAPAQSVIVIKNSKINGKILHDPGDNSAAWPSITVEDTEIDGGSGGNYSTVMFGNYTLRRVNVYGGNHNLYCAYNCTIEDSWVHSPVSVPGSHNNAIFAWGHDLRVTHTTLACDIPTVQDGGCSSNLLLKGGFANATIERSLFEATTTGGFYYCAYGAQYAPKSGETRERNVVFRDNVFQRGPTDKCGGVVGQSGGWAVTSFDATAPGNVWAGNKWDDGSAVDPQ